MAGPQQTWDADELQALLDLIERATMLSIDGYIQTDAEREALAKLRKGGRYYE